MKYTTIFIEKKKKMLAKLFEKQDTYFRKQNTKKSLGECKSGAKSKLT